MFNREFWQKVKYNLTFTDRLGVYIYLYSLPIQKLDSQQDFEVFN